jgi:hypothetical protein
MKVSGGAVGTARNHLAVKQAGRKGNPTGASRFEPTAMWFPRG